MNNFISHKKETNLLWLRLMPFVVVGALAFSSTSASNLNDTFRVYLVFLEAKLFILVMYFITSKFSKRGKKSLLL